MPTELQIRKIDREFELFDGDRNGVIERGDYVALAHRLLDVYAVSPSSRRGRSLVTAYEALWHRHLHDFDHDRDKRLTREEFRRAIKRRVLRENGFNEVYVPLLRAIVELVDCTERGVLNRTEFARLMAVFGVSGTDSMVTFSELDADDDERLTVGEFVGAFRDFYFSTDPDAAANRLLGWVH
ncbi:MAG: EF-hand domain-containing protein [Actinomadura sp.]